MSKLYGKMMDTAYSSYYERFRVLNALSEETAVTKEELFPEGQSYYEAKMMQKMLSSAIVKRKGLNHYWLDESVVSNPGKVVKRQIIMIVVAVVLAFAYMAVRNYFM